MESPCGNAARSALISISSVSTQSPAEGRISVCSPDHISIIIHRTFNVSIPRHHIPQDEWEFEYGPAENDPEYAPDALGDDAEAKHEEAGGRWIHRLTAQTIGDEAGYLKFTVVG